MNRALCFIITLVVAGLARATDMPLRCNGVEISSEPDEHSVGLTMVGKDYTIDSESDGELSYVSVIVPAKYKGLSLQQINLIKLESGSPALVVALNHDVKGDRAESKHALIWPAAMNSVRFNAFYADILDCSEGHSIYKRSRVYDLEFKHNN